MALSILVAIYVFLTIEAFLHLGFGAGLMFAGFGVVIIALLPTFKKMQKQKVQKMIEEDRENPFINVNKAPYYILEELPSIERVLAKRIVYIRRHHGKYQSVEDFFEKLGIREQEQRELRKYVIV